MKWNPEDEIEFIVRKLNHELTTAEERQFQCRRSGTSQFVSGNRIHIPSFERSENRF